MSARKEPHHHEHELITLVVSSLASAAAAVVVHGLWPQATLIGAAVSPVLVAVFAELLRRPVQQLSVLATVRPAGRIAVDHAGSLQEVRVYRARPQWLGALAVASAAFVIGAGGLTVAETLLHRSVAGRSDATTLFGRGHSAEAAPAITRQTTTVIVTTPALTTPTKSGHASGPRRNDDARDPSHARPQADRTSSASRSTSSSTSTASHDAPSEGSSSEPSSTTTTATTPTGPATVTTP